MAKKVTRTKVAKKKATSQAKASSKKVVAKSRSASKKKAATRKKVTSSRDVVMTHKQIAQRAYEIWLRKGRPLGCDSQNWEQAERELRDELH